MQWPIVGTIHQGTQLKYVKRLSEKVRQFRQTDEEFERRNAISKKSPMLEIKKHNIRGKDFLCWAH